MGTIAAIDMADQAGVNEVTIGWHLQSNHYPPIPSFMTAYALQAIDAYNEEEPERLIELEGVQWKGQSSAPAWALVEYMHLDAFIGVGTEVEL